MKEMPGAPALPEGWFYRVRSSRDIDGDFRWWVEVRKPWFWGSWVVAEATVYNGESRWWWAGRTKPRINQLAVAAQRAYDRAFPNENGMEGDYR